jgi:GT2 family glycosyltransferase
LSEFLHELESTLRLSVVIPATDRPATLERCREAIAGALDPPDEVIVVDGPPGWGPARARNAGAARASGSVLVFVDSDVVVDRHAFRRIRAVMEDDPRIVAVFGSYDDEPGRNGTVSTFRNLLHHHVHQHSGGPASTFWAGLGAVRAAPFLAAGGFDAERFPEPSVEDIDLGLRLHARGARIVLDPAIQGTHLKRWRPRDMVATDLLRRGVPWVALCLEHGPGAARLNASRRHRVSALLCTFGLSAALTGRRRLALLQAAAFVRLNRRFYLLLVRRAGARAAAAGVALHIVHTLAAVAAVPLGLREHFAGAWRTPPAELPAEVSLPPAPAPAHVGEDGSRRGRDRRRRARTARPLERAA